MTLAALRAEIRAACAAAGRSADSVSLIAVSKMQDAAAIETLIAQGQYLFGENRVQEAAGKFPRLREKYPQLRLHFIGHLQTNKARDAVALFDAIDSLDRAELAEALAREMKKQNRPLPCLVQVNTGEEPQKGGVAPRDLPALLAAAKNLGLRVEGLMCIPPAGDIPDLHFALLHKLAAENGLSTLSMGMSADFPRAIRYGATHIRVGTALFGERA